MCGPLIHPPGRVVGETTRPDRGVGRLYAEMSRDVSPHLPMEFPMKPQTTALRIQKATVRTTVKAGLSVITSCGRPNCCLTTD